MSGRRPLGKDVQLDYEEMSDQDWEEEPEGESLSVRPTKTAQQHGAAQLSTAQHDASLTNAAWTARTSSV